MNKKEDLKIQYAEALQGIRFSKEDLIVQLSDVKYYPQEDQETIGKEMEQHLDMLETTELVLNNWYNQLKVLV